MELGILAMSMADIHKLEGELRTLRAFSIETETTKDAERLLLLADKLKNNGCEPEYISERTIELPVLASRVDEYFSKLMLFAKAFM